MTNDISHSIAFYADLFPYIDFVRGLGLENASEEITHVQYEKVVTVLGERVLLDVVASLPEDEQEKIGMLVPQECAYDTLCQFIEHTHSDILVACIAYAQAVFAEYLEGARRINDDE